MLLGSKLRILCLIKASFSLYLYQEIDTIYQNRPHNHDSTASRLLSEVKHDLALLVLRWGTTLEHRVLIFFCWFDWRLIYFDSHAKVALAYLHHVHHVHHLCTFFFVGSTWRMIVIFVNKKRHFAAKSMIL